MTEIASNEFFDVKVDLQKNRIFNSNHNFWTSEVMDNYLISMDKAMSMVQKNFTLVVDLRKLKTFSPELAESSKQMMIKLNQAGLYKVAEILPESAITKMQLNKSTKTTNMPNQQFSEVSAGETWLDAEVQKL